MNEKSSTSDATPVPGGPKRRESQTQMLVLELQKLMRAEIEKAVATAMAETKNVAEKVARSVANDVAQDVVQNALEAYQGDDSSDLQADLVSALKDSFSSSPPAAKRRASRVRLAERDARPGTKATARAGNNHIPVEIVSGPFMVNGKPLYKVKRLTKGKDFTGGLKPLRDLFVFTEEDAESLHSTTPPSRRRAK